MDNLETTSFEEKIREATRTPKPNAAFAEGLWQQIATESQERARRPFYPHPFPKAAKVAIALILAVVLVIVAIGPQKVAYAFQSLLGYFPGVGFVQNMDTVHRLTEPVQHQRAAYTVTVEDAIANKRQTWIKIQIESSEEFTRGFDQLEYVSPLLISAGQSQTATHFQIYRQSAIIAEFIFPALPEDTSAVTLVLPQLPLTQKEQAPENWQFELSLQQAKEDESFSTVIEQNWESETINGLTLSLESLAQGTEQAALKVRLESDDPKVYPAEEWTARLLLQDQVGRIYPLTQENLLGMGNTWTEVLLTTALNENETLTLKMEEVLVAEALSSNNDAAHFYFELGDQPQVGQTWDLDQTLSSEKFTLRVSKATLVENQNGNLQLVFDVKGQPDITNITFSCTTQICDGPGIGYNNGDKFQVFISLKAVPTEPIDIQLQTVLYQITGPWEIQWQTLNLPIETSTITTNPPTPIPSESVSSEVTSNNPILAESISLLDQGLSPFLSGSGWVHVVTENQTEEDLGENPQGGIIPSHDIMENWYELNEEGYIIRMITLLKTSDSEIIQQAITEGVYSYNFTLNTILKGDGKLRKINFNNEALAFFQQMVSNDLPLYRYEMNCENKRCLLITPFESEKQLSPELYQQIYAFAGLPRQMWIDLETGQPIRHERFGMDAEGNLQLKDSSRLLTLERAAPPQELLDLFEQVVFPVSGD